MSLYYSCYGHKLGLSNTTMYCALVYVWVLLGFFQLKKLKAPVIYGEKW